MQCKGGGNSSSVQKSGQIQWVMYFRKEKPVLRVYTGLTIEETKLLPVCTVGSFFHAWRSAPLLLVKSPLIN